ncbi:MAG: hypothetical protein K2L54_01350 [Clostridiales bacterium]|nr:hypothetical protein [Clostridiales bacterium]
MNEKDRKWLKKEIKQIKAVICAFKYQYFLPLDCNLTPEDLERFDAFRQDTLFKLVDQWKKMEFELTARRGRLYGQVQKQ